MKKYLILIVSIFQPSSSFGQCTTTETVESYTPIVNVKCTDGGYLPPKGYEWMKKAVLWHRIPYLGAGIEGLNYHVDGMTDYTTKGNTLSDAISRIRNLKSDYNKDYGHFSTGVMFKTWNINPDGKLQKIDCNLGYVAYVQLIDGFYRDEIKTYNNGILSSITAPYAPNQGFGISCGQPTQEAALKAAWEVARKSLGKPAVAFSFYTTINTEPKDETSENQFNGNIDCFVWRGRTVGEERNARNFGKHPNIPDNADGFVNYIKKDLQFFIDNNKITDAALYKYNHFNLPYPVFTQKMSGSSKQNTNMQKTEPKRGNIVENTSIAKLNNSLNADNKDFFIIKENLNNHLKTKGLVATSSNSEYGRMNYFLNEKKSIVLTQDYKKKKFTLKFSGDEINLGEKINNEIESTLAYSNKYNYGSPTYYIIIDLNSISKFNYLNENFKIISPSNFTVVDIFPRTTEIRWTNFPNATTYQVIVQYANGNENRYDWNAKEFLTNIMESTTKNNFLYSGVGAQVHRFRVVAKKGEQTIAETGWNYINYKK